MAHVVFLRGANVGGKNVFRPAQFAASLAHLGAVNIGAAGTFVVREKTSSALLRRELVERLPFECHIAIRPAKEILELVRAEPFAGVTFSRDLRGWVAVLGAKPKARPVLPLTFPNAKAWSVRIDRVDGAFALGVSQRRPGGSVYPSDSVESAFGVPATTRWWETFGRIVAALESS